MNEKINVKIVNWQTALSNLEEMQSSNTYRSRERSMGSIGPMRSRPMEKRHDTSPYSGVPYLSPPPPDTWRRTNSDSALHQSANEACQSASSISHRRGSDACQLPVFYLFIIIPPTVFIIQNKTLNNNIFKFAANLFWWQISNN